MKIILKITLILLFLVGIGTELKAQGREVTIFLKGKCQKRGELLSVRDSAISILTGEVEVNEDIKKYPELIDVVLLQDLDRVRLEEVDVSGVGPGMLIGAGVGAGLSLWGLSGVSGGHGTGGDFWYITAAAFTSIVAVVGSGIGAIVGTLQSEDAKTIRPPINNEWLEMRKYARFKGSEPTYVSDIIDKLLKEAK